MTFSPRFSFSFFTALFFTALMPAASSLADDALSPSASSELSPWDGEFHFAQVNGRPAHYASIQAKASATCPTSSAATKLTFSIDPEDGLIRPHPKDGSHPDLSPVITKGSHATWSASVAMKGGAVYRLQATASCCSTIDAKGECAGESEPVSTLSNELELPPTIDGVRALQNGLFHGALLANDQMDTFLYDSVPTPSWKRADANLSKFVKFEGTGISFKTTDYTSHVSPITLTTLRPTFEGTLTATLTVKGRLYTPEGDFVRNYTLTSEPFDIPVHEEPCVLDANFNTFILEGEAPKCLDKSVYQPTDEEDLEETSGCSTQSNAPIAALPVLFLISLRCLLGRRRREG